MQRPNGELIEVRLSDPLKGEPYSHYRVITGKDGKIKSLSESTLYSDIYLTQGTNSEIITGKRPLVTSDPEAVNAVRRYYGEPPLKY